MLIYKITYLNKYGKVKEKVFEASPRHSPRYWAHRAIDQYEEELLSVEVYARVYAPVGGSKLQRVLH